MIYVILAVLAISVVHFCDPVAMRRLPVFKPVAWIVGISLTVYAAIKASMWPDKLQLPLWTTWFGWIVLSVSLLLVVYSLFICLPFYRTYVARGVGDRLITTGFYSLTRHPGVIWTALCVIGLFFVSKSLLVLTAGPVLIVLDVISVFVQDRFFFGKMFAGYDRYRKETPMLVPNRKSLNAFAGSFRRLNPRLRTGGDNDFELS